jgi:hypothetical protein
LLTATLLPSALLPETLLTSALLALTLKGCRMHAGATAIGFGASLVTIAAHGRARPVSSERVRPIRIGAIDVAGLMLNASVAPD